MTQKNDVPVLVFSFLVTAGLVGGGFWWLTQKSGLNVGTLFSQGSSSTSPTNSSNNSNSSSVQDFAQVQNVPSGLFTYGGSTSWAPIRRDVDAAIQAARPEFRLRYVNPTGEAPGSATGIRMLMRDELAFAQSSRPVTEQEYQQAQQRGIKLKQIPVAIDALAVAVNPSLNVSGLTVQQLGDIYTGKLTNWSQVGGPNVPIQPITRPVSAGGTIELFAEQIMKGRGFGSKVQTVSTTTGAVRKLAQTFGGIYFASAPEIVDQCTVKPIAIGRTSNELVSPYQGSLIPPSQCPAKRNQLNEAAIRGGQYPITRNLFVVIKQNNQKEQQAGEAYTDFVLSNQGQTLLEKAGFVSIR
ncbi:PstS family phosphate ABC transporter substrate-binding protein [Phormidium sp. CLA17]|uniref:PstS family phosphate ABC transporter substrate-binding protein n=1 Tax=Leptolyngbya sp. Cla-17 TaxID=2803751 RepID=UPI00149209DF|nr:PstS family phosphate ABC transporter substrate-binding protein [Leptolyngbya sp. Cla-17]MBM0741097.1 PstS family phosphate ABC transporter substrate-binding protein [Leptolyngbya sp. Cla-17]